MKYEPLPTLMVVVSDPSVQQYLVQSIDAVIGHVVNIMSCTLKDDVGRYPKPDLVMASGPAITRSVQDLYPAVPVITARRQIVASNLETLVMAPRGTRVLIVYQPKEAANRIISSLQALGLNHLNYLPFQGTENDRRVEYDLAITAGMSHLVPDDFPNLVDLGNMALSIETFAEILEFFGLSMSYLKAFELNYAKIHIDTCQRLRDLLNESNRMRQYQAKILEEIEEGIAVVDDKCEVLICSPVIDRLLASSVHDSDSVTLLKDLLKQVDGELDSQTVQPPAQGVLLKKGTLAFYAVRRIVDVAGKPTYVYILRNIEEIQQLEQKVRRKLYHHGFQAKHTFASILGSCEKMERMKAIAQKFARTNQTILLVGESGTGKELLAQAIHNASSRADKPFVAVNMGAIPQNLLESELFGYTEGAFTGAKKGGKRGVFELAHGGTLFLDEIGDAPLHIQLLLLRALEEREFFRVGGENMVPVDVRVIAATNRDLEEEVAAGRFRSDLFYRLNVLSIQTVPLRELRDNIPVLAKQLAQKRFGTVRPMEGRAVEILSGYPWPGNFRELGNVLEYLYCTSDAGTITADDLPAYLLKRLLPSDQLSDILNAEPLARRVLELFEAASPDALGRAAVRDLLNLEGIKTTESELKRLFRLLKDRQLLHVGTTRQGSALTALGQLALERLRQKDCTTEADTRDEFLSGRSGA